MRTRKDAKNAHGAVGVVEPQVQVLDARKLAIPSQAPYTQTKIV